MDVYEVINEEKKLKLVITKNEGAGYYLLEVCSIEFGKISANYLYYRLEDLFSVMQSKYGISKDKWGVYHK